MTDFTSQTDYAVPTGDFIEEWLDDNEMSQAELSRRMGVSSKHVSKLVNGAAPLSPEVALKLSLVTGVPQSHWMNLEARYQADLARLAAQEEFATGHTGLLKDFSDAASYLRKHGFISGAATMRDPGRLMLELLAFFKVGTPDALSSITRVHSAAFRNSAAHTPVNPSVATWLRLGAIQVESESWDDLPPFDLARAQEVVQRMARISGDDPSSWAGQIKSTLNSGGIEIAYIDGVQGCRAYGATQWIQKRPLVQLSLRGKNDGQFWFTLMHELGHVVLQPNVDVTDLDPDLDSYAEEQANVFALDRLVAEEHRDEMSRLRSTADVRRFAEKLGISTGIVVGQLQRNGQWHYSQGNSLYKRLTIIEEE